MGLGRGTPGGQKLRLRSSQQTRMGMRMQGEGETRT